MKYLEQLGRLLTLLGVPGVFLVALLDSAAVPMVGGPDAVVILIAWQNPGQAALAVLAAAAGSVLGCLVLHRIGRAGGEHILNRISPERRARLVAGVERNAMWAVFVAVAAPPPFPTKPVIVAAGAGGVSLGRFSAAVLAGRLVRWSILAWMGVRFGDQTAGIIREHSVYVFPAIAVVVAAVFVVRRLRRRRREH